MGVEKQASKYSKAHLPVDSSYSALRPKIGRSVHSRAAFGVPLRLSWLLWLVGKYLAGRRRVHAGASFGLAVSGILVGVATLIAILTGMTGMQGLLTDSIDEVTAYHLQLIVNSEADSLLVRKRLQQESFIRNVTRYREAPMLLSSEYGEPVIAFVRAVEVADFMADRGREAVMRTMGSVLQNDLANANHLWVGRKFSFEHGFGVGDMIQVISAEYENGQIAAKQYKFLISSLYRLGNPNIEKNYVFTGLNPQSEKLFYSNEYYLGVKIQNRVRAEVAKKTVGKILQDMQQNGGIGQFQLRTGREANQVFFSALRTEKSFLQVLVSLIFIVVAFHIFQSTRHTVFARIPELMLLRTLGAGAIELRCIFLLESLFVGCLGVSLGTIAGILMSKYINEILFGISVLLLRVPGLIPVIATKISWLDLLLVISSALVFSSAAGWLATRRLLHIQPIEVLRHD